MAPTSASRSTVMRDRLIAVDHTGKVVDGDHIIAITAKDLRVAGSCATTRWS